MILIDTNIPARIAQPGHPHRQPALDAIQLLAVRDNETFAISTHSLYEFYFVMTKSKNGFGYTAARASAEIAQIRATFQVVYESAKTYSIWEGLVAQHNVTNRRAYDAKLVATMLDAAIPILLTFNDADFSPFNSIQVINPFDVLNIPRI